MKRCEECFYYWRSNCYYDDVYHVESDNRACEDYINKLCCDCNSCIWCTFHAGMFVCHKEWRRNRRFPATDAQCHFFKSSKYKAFLDPRTTAPRRCASVIRKKGGC